MPACLEPVDLHARIDRERGRWNARRKETERVDAVDNLDVVPIPRQQVGELGHDDRVTAKMFWWEERRKQAEAHGIGLS
jgi:hypothetical protein